MCEEIKRKQYKRLKPEELEEAIRLRADGVPIANLAQRFSISERQLHEPVIESSRNRTKSRSSGAETKSYSKCYSRTSFGLDIRRTFE